MPTQPPATLEIQPVALALTMRTHATATLTVQAEPAQQAPGLVAAILAETLEKGLDRFNPLKAQQDLLTLSVYRSADVMMRDSLTASKYHSLAPILLAYIFCVYASSDFAHCTVCGH